MKKIKLFCNVCHVDNCKKRIIDKTRCKRKINVIYKSFKKRKEPFEPLTVIHTRLVLDENGNIDKFEFIDDVLKGEF